MGENKKNIFVVGCPSIDALKNAKDINTKLLNKKFGLKFDDKFACIVAAPRYN